MVSENSANIDECLILKRAIYRQDRKAVRVLQARYYHQMERYIGACIGSATYAKDLAQDIFVELCKGNGRYDGREDVERYLLGVARNLVRRYWRKKAKSGKTVPIEEIGDSLADSRDIGLHRHITEQVPTQVPDIDIAKMLARLPPKAREALKLRLIDGLSSREAAKKAGCSVGTFRKRISNGLQKVRTSWHGGATPKQS